MPIFLAGSTNIAALTVPDTYVQITPPTQNYIQGAASGILGIVGTATWGPVNVPTSVPTPAAATFNFGAQQNRKYDLVTAIQNSILNGAQNIQAVRVTDGTDTAATATIGTNGLTVTAKYTGTLGNTISVAISAGSAANSWRVTVAVPNTAPEVFDNLATGLSGNAVWLALAAAINNGSSALRGPSKLIVGTAGIGTSAPVAGPTVLASGTDGATTITSSVLVGTTSPRTGMYALSATGADVFFLADVDDSTTWTTQVAFAQSIGAYGIGVLPAGTSISSAVTAKTTAAIDSPYFKVLHGDWAYFADNVNSVPFRMVSPQAFLAGLLANLSPEQSALNKPLFGIIGTQTSLSGQPYAESDIQTLANAGIDLITNPCPGGAYFGSRIGRNTSSNPVINQDNYPRLTTFIADSIQTAMGKYVGVLQTPTVRTSARDELTAFLSGLEDDGMIGNADGTQPFSVVLNDSNNPPSAVALGQMRADLQITYLSVITTMLVNMQAGQSVTVTVTNVQPA